ncbi:MAG TPA: hypothetical protein VN958_21140 [Chitinophagaceae bacterium]|nr:hypothetical protein [Chitinophagaceae bacterium]
MLPAMQMKACLRERSSGRDCDATKIPGNTKAGIMHHAQHPADKNHSRQLSSLEESCIAI